MEQCKTCSQIERIVVMETEIKQIFPFLLALDEKVDALLAAQSIGQGKALAQSESNTEILQEIRGIQDARASRGFLMGVLTVGVLIGSGIAAGVKPITAIFTALIK